MTAKSGEWLSECCWCFCQIIGSKVGPGHRTMHRQKTIRHLRTSCGMRSKTSKSSSHNARMLSSHRWRTPSPMRLRHPKRFSIKPGMCFCYNPVALWTLFCCSWL